jgi:tetratricopeptide (TPR) repeat protein
MIKDFLEQFLFFPNKELKKTPFIIGINYEDIYDQWQTSGFFHIYRSSTNLGVGASWNLLCKKIFESNPKFVNESVMWGNIGDSYMNLEKLDSALLYFQKSYEVILKQKLSVGNNEEFLANEMLALINLAEINIKLKNYEIALAYLYSSITKTTENKQRRYFQMAYNDIAKAYIGLNHSDSAIKYLRKSYNLSKASGYYLGVLNSLDLLVNIYKNQKNFDSTFKYQTEILIAKDSINSIEKIRDLFILSSEESLRESQIEDEKMEFEKERKKNLKLGIIAIFIPTFSLIVYLIGKKKKRNIKIIRFLGLASLLMVFEFITLLIHPFIEKITNHDAILMYLSLLFVAAFLVPLHHKFEGYVRKKSE